MQLLGTVRGLKNRTLSVPSGEESAYLGAFFHGRGASNQMPPEQEVTQGGVGCKIKLTSQLAGF
jgi:hypothetical protein